MHTHTHTHRTLFYFVSTILMFFIFCVIISSCTKDEIEIDAIEKVSFVDDLMNYTNENNTITRSDPDSIQNLRPSNIELQGLADYLQASTDSDVWMPQFVSVYGYPVWSQAVKSNGEEGGFAITLPLIKNDQVIGVLRYINTPDIIHAYFRGYNHIINIPNLEYTEQEIGRATILALSFVYFQYIIDGSYNTDLVAWMQADQISIDESESTSIRSEIFCFPVIDGYEFVVNSSDIWSNYVANEVSISHVECIILGGPIAGLNPPTGNIDPDIPIDPSDPPSGPGKDEKEKEKEEDVDDCLERMSEHVNGELDQLLLDLESTNGNKVCLEKLQYDIISLLKADQTIDCNNSAWSEIKMNLEVAVSSKVSEFDQAIADIRNSDISDPCNPDLSSDDIADNAIAAMNESGGCGVDALESVMTGNDHIINYLTDIRLKCIYDKLLLGSDNVFCSTFENFLGDTDIDLTLSNSIQSTANATTTPYFLASGSNQGNTINISINTNQIQDFCEIVIVGLFLHEGLHAEMFRLLNDPSININDFSSIWSEYDEKIDQHDNMAELYIYQLKLALKERFGSRYTDQQYEAVAWHGLGNVAGEGVNTSAWNALTTIQQNNLISQFESVNSSCIDDECK